MIPCLQMAQEGTVRSIISVGLGTHNSGCFMGDGHGCWHFILAIAIATVVLFWFNGHSARQWPVRPQRRHAVSAIRWDSVLEWNPFCFPLPKPFFPAPPLENPQKTP